MFVNHNLISYHFHVLITKRKVFCFYLDTIATVDAFNLSGRQYSCFKKFEIFYLNEMEIPISNRNEKCDDPELVSTLSIPTTQSSRSSLNTHL